MRRSLFALTLLVCLAVPALGAGALFESPHVHPLDLTPGGNTLLAVNTDDHRLSVFDLSGGGVQLVAEIPVGLEPVSVRARTDGEAWVVNHLSDAVSIVDLTTMNVRQTLLVGDEPTDVVFAGSPEKAFVAVSQEDRVRVYDAAAPGAVLADLVLDGSDPRSLAVSGGVVWVTLLDGQNRTTIVPETVVTGTLGLPAPNPPMAAGLPPAPGTGLIVRHNGVNWVDELSRPWDFAVPYTLSDHDLIGIDVAGLTVTQTIQTVGTTLFNVVPNPAGTKLYVTNQEAFNEVRFEPNLQAQFLENRVAVIDLAGPSVSPVHLNSHINYAVPGGSPAERALSLGLPTDVVVAPDGLTVYVAASGSAKIGVLDAAGVVQDRFDVGNGPSGLVLDTVRDRLYVLEKFDDTVSSVDPATGIRTTVALGFNPTDLDVKEGRRLFYDTVNSSAHGDLSCASCHVFVGMDNVSWDLGDPQGAFAPAPPGQLGSSGFHPMKGPMATQSMKGLEPSAPFHWRGDRAALSDFNGAFMSLLGRSQTLSPAEFAQFEAFVFSVAYPPNPFRELDESYKPTADGSDPAAGEAAYMTGLLVAGANCVDCHALPTGENGLIIPASALLEPQDMVVPQLRNMYEKTRFDNTASVNVRGFGFTHDGAVDDLVSFLQFPAFNFADDAARRDVASFLMAFDTGTPAAVGAQWTMDGTNEPAGTPRLDTLEGQADLGTIGLIAKGRNTNSELRGWTYTGSGQYLSDREAEGTLLRVDLLSIAGAGHEVTFTAVPAGCETRLGIDRDEDGYRDRDELDAGSDPADPTSIPSTSGIGELIAGLDPGFRVAPNPVGASAKATVQFTLAAAEVVSFDVFDVLGRRVAVVLPGDLFGSGDHAVPWNLRDREGRPVSGGIYFLRLQAESFRATQRLVVMD